MGTPRERRGGRSRSPLSPAQKYLLIGAGAAGGLVLWSALSIFAWTHLGGRLGPNPERPEAAKKAEGPTTGAEPITAIAPEPVRKPTAPTAETVGSEGEEANPVERIKNAPHEWISEQLDSGVGYFVTTSVVPAQMRIEKCAAEHDKAHCEVTLEGDAKGLTQDTVTLEVEGGTRATVGWRISPGHMIVTYKDLELRLRPGTKNELLKLLAREGGAD